MHGQKCILAGQQRGKFLHPCAWHSAQIYMYTHKCICEWTKPDFKCAQYLTVAAVEVAVVPCTVLWGVPVCTAVAVPNVVVCAVPPRTIWGCREHEQKVILLGMYQSPFSWTIKQTELRDSTFHSYCNIKSSYSAVAVERRSHQMAQNTAHSELKSSKLIKNCTIFGGKIIP